MSGMVMPAMRPTIGPQMPVAMRTVSVAMKPAGVSTPRTRPPSIRMPVTGVLP